MSRTKWYLECYKYRTGCRVVIHTNYTDKTVDRLRVLHQNGTHNHPPLREPLKCAQSLSGQNNHTRKTWETPHAEYASGGGRKSVVKKEDVNKSSKGQAIFTPLHDQDIYPGEEEDERKSNARLKPSSAPKYPRVMDPELDIFNKPARILVAGASNSGKSYLVSKLIQRWHEKFERIVVIGSDLENVLGLNVLRDDFYNPLNESNECESSLVIFDDVIFNPRIMKVAAECFTRGRHKNPSLIF